MQNKNEFSKNKWYTRKSYTVREIIIPGAIAILKGTDAGLDRGPYHLVPT